MLMKGYNDNRLEMRTQTSPLSVLLSTNFQEEIPSLAPLLCGGFYSSETGTL